jgi:hypothetical protein
MQWRSRHRGIQGQRISFIFGCAILVCAGACGPAAQEAKPIPLPANSVQLEIVSASIVSPVAQNGLFPYAQPADSQNKKIPIAGATKVAMKAVADTVTVGFTLQFWYVTSVVANPSISFWTIGEQPLCYEIKGKTVTQVTSACALFTEPKVLPAISSWFDGMGNGLDNRHNYSRALFGIENENTMFRSDAMAPDGTLIASGLNRTFGAFSVVGVSANLKSLKEYWGLDAAFHDSIFFEGVADEMPMNAVFAVDAAAKIELKYFIPAPDGQPFLARTMSTQGDPTVYWADRTDTVVALNVNEHNIAARRVRKPLTNPVTKTVGTLEAGDSVFTLVLSPTNITREQNGTLSVGTDTGVVNLSLVTSPALKETELPLAPFAPLWAHTPNAVSLVVCFSENLDDAKLNIDQFSADNELKLLSVSNTVVPQCARLQTSAMSRQKRYRITVKNVTSRSGSVLKESILSATPDDSSTGISFAKVPTLMNSFEPSGYLPLPQGGYLAAKELVFGIIDAQGTTFKHLEIGPTTKPPVSGFDATSKADLAANGIWTSYAGTDAKIVLALVEPNGQKTVFDGTTNPEMNADQGVLAVVGDGSVLLRPKTGISLVRITKAGPSTRLPSAVTMQSFQGIEPISKHILFQEGGRFKRLQLPDVVMPNSYAGSPSNNNDKATACETQGVLYWCGNQVPLRRLGETQNVDIEPMNDSCQQVVPDGAGNCWSTSVRLFSPVISVLKLRGTTATPVSFVNPLDSKVSLFLPEFIGDAVFFNSRVFRTDVATFNVMTAGIP